MGEISEENVKLGHLERTVDEPRDLSLHRVTIRKIDEINPSIRLFRFEIHDRKGIKFLPGQWLDVYAPNIPQAGGFTITCPPSKAIPIPFPSPHPELNTKITTTNTNNESGDEDENNNPQYPYLELAIQKSPQNPVASHLWQTPFSKILNTPLDVRVGGSFVFPPFPFHNNNNENENDIHNENDNTTTTTTTQNQERKPLNKVIFIAGGVGINPLMSMLGYIAEEFPSHSSSPSSAREQTGLGGKGDQTGNENGSGSGSEKLEVHFLYSVKDPNPDSPLEDQSSSQILFLNRISNLFQHHKITGKFKLFLTQPQPHTTTSATESNLVPTPEDQHQSSYPVYKRRISKQDIASALGSNKDTSAVYICGVPAMTDSFVELLISPEESGGFGMDTDRVLFEKWW